MQYSRRGKDGKLAIDTVPVFVAALGNSNPLDIDDFEDFLDECQNLVKGEFSPQNGALNNARGAWYEWLYAIGFEFFRKESPDCDVLIQLPNVSQFDVYTLYKEEIYNLITDFRNKTAPANVSLHTSNPDFVIVDKELATSSAGKLGGRTAISDVTNQHKRFVHKCEIGQIKGFVTIKTSLRPDRRLQMSHEGALAKALYEHLNTRLWLTDAPGLSYFACSMEVKPADQRALTTVATHSLLSVNVDPVPAVDSLYAIKGGSELKKFFSSIL